MKKVFICMLLVLLAICLFVGCSSSPKEEDLPQSISFKHEDETIIFNRDGSGTISYDGTPISITFNFTQTNGLFVTPLNCPFFKDKNNTIITSFDELLSLSTVYHNSKFGKPTPDWETWTKQ